MATHSSILARRAPWTEEPGGLQAMWLRRVRHNLVTQQQLFISLLRGSFLISLVLSSFINIFQMELLIYIGSFDFFS